MHSSPLIRRKLLPARLPEVHLPRPTLLASLARGLHPDKKLTLVCAGPGHGKSTLIAEHLRQSELPSAWVGWEAGDEDLLSFFHYLCGALEGLVPGVGERVMGLLRSAPAPSAIVATAAGLLAEGVGEALPEGAVLVLDDLHEVQGHPDVLRALEALVSYWPESWQLIFITRERPDLPLAQWQVRQQVVELGPKELRFSALELRQLLERLAGVVLSDAEAVAWLERTEGWVAPAILAAQSVRQGGGDPHALLMSELAHPTHLYDYLAQELYAQQEAETQAFMLATALPHALSPEACRMALGANDAGRRLQQLRQANVLTLEAEGGPERYRYHPSFRHFLQGRLASERGAEALQALHLAWAKALAEAAPEEALHLALGAPDLGLAAELLAAWAPLRLDEGRVGSVADAVARFPSTSRRTLWAPAYFGAEAARLQGSFDAAEAAFQAAEGLAPDLEGQRQCLRRRAAIALARGLLGQAEALLAQAQVPEEEVPIPELAFQANLQGALALAQDQAPQAQAAYEAALAWHRGTEDLAGSAKVLNNLGLLHTRHGRFEEALSTLGEAVALAEAAGRLPHPMTLNNLAAVHTYQGHHQEALAAAGQALEIAGLLGARRDACYAWMALGFARRGAEDLRRAEEAFAKARDEARALGDASTQAKAIAALAELAAAEGQGTRALGLLEEAQGLPPGSAPLAAQGDLLALVASAEAWGKAQLSWPQARLAELEAYRGLALSKGYRFRACQAAYLLAHLHRQLAQGAIAKAWWELGEQEAKAWGYTSLAAREALRWGLEARPLPQAGPPPLPGPPPLAPHLSVWSFGAFEAAKGGERIPNKAWRGHKPKLILAHLLVHPRGVTKEALTELLYGDVDLDRTAILVLLTRLRQAVEDKADGPKARRLIQLVEGRYLLDPAATIQHDLADFHYWGQQAAQDTLSEAHRHQALRQALALAARGPYLADLDSASPWVETQREGHRRAVEGLHAQLRHSHLRAGRWAELLADAESHLAWDPCAQSAHEAKLATLVHLGRQDEALRHASLITSVYRKELDAPPPEALRRMAEQLRAHQRPTWDEGLALGLPA